MTRDHSGQPKPRASTRWQRVCEQAARCIRSKDRDRTLLNSVLKALDQIASGVVAPLLNKSITLDINGSTFKGYYKQVKQRDVVAKRARNNFVLSNLRLVMSIVQRYNYGKLPLSDLIQEGNIGLIKAVGRYDPRRGYRFSTYAIWWIRHAITRAIADHGRLVRVPVHRQSTYYRVAQTSSELSRQMGREPTMQEIGQRSDVSTDVVEESMINLASCHWSLDKECSEDDHRPFIDFIHDPETKSPPESVMFKEVAAEVRQILRDLKPIEADVLRRRFGLENDKRETLKEIGENYSLSRERIRQIQELTLQKIRGELEHRNAL